MIRALYSGVSGLKNHQIRMDVIGNNISNVNTTAYKASRVNFQDMLSQTIRGTSGEYVEANSINAAQVGTGSTISSINVIYNQGPNQHTGRPLDVAISGNGFFVVKTVDSDGEECQYLTRDGAFSIDKTGNLVNSSGYQVIGAEGESIVFDDAIDHLNIDRYGMITGTYVDGTVIAEGDFQIGLCFVPNPESLMKQGNNLYSATVNTNELSYDGEGSYIDDDGFGLAGAGGRGVLESMRLESSNVDLTEEFSNMIVTQRGYQANARVITTSDKILEELINLKR